jgi:hypothetical protein
MPGRRSSVRWWRRGEAAGNIDTRAEGPFLFLEYKCRTIGAEWESVTERVLLYHTPCHYGGSRPWFICPGVKGGVPCGRRVARLYAAGKYFFCRHCYNLAYESQNEPKRDRLLSKAQNIRRRLGGSADMTEPFPPRPKGMHQKTYLRLRYKAEQAERRSDTMLGEWFQFRK